MTIKINNRYLNKADIFSDLTSKDPEVNKRAIELIQTDPELRTVKMFPDYCEFTLKKIENKDARMVYQCSLDKIKEIISKRGHFSSHAKNFLGLLESKKYSHLLSDPEVKKSYDIVKEHYKESAHSNEYEMRLNHLQEIFYYLQKERHDSPSRQTTNLETVANSA